MRLTQALRSLVRRWYLTIVAILVTAGLCFFTLQAVPPTYEAGASVLLLPPTKQLPAGANPFLFLGGMQQAAEVLVKYLNGDGQQQSFAAQRPTASYTIAVDTTTSGPVITAVITDATPDGALAATEDFIQSIPQGLAALEKSASVPDSASIETLTLTQDRTATRDTKGVIRVVGAVAAAGLLAALLLVVMVDGLLVRGSRRRLDPSLQFNIDPKRHRLADVESSKVTRSDTDARPTYGAPPRLAIPSGRRPIRLRPSPPPSDDDEEASNQAESYGSQPIALATPFDR